VRTSSSTLKHISAFPENEISFPFESTAITFITEETTFGSAESSPSSTLIPTMFGLFVFAIALPMNSPLSSTIAPKSIKTVSENLGIEFEGETLGIAGIFVGLSDEKDADICGVVTGNGGRIYSGMLVIEEIFVNVVDAVMLIDMELVIEREIDLL